MGQLRDLELLIDSRYPIIAAETEEEDRLEDLLRRVASELDLPFYVWTCVDGLYRPPQKTLSIDTRQPLQALAHVGAARGDGVYFFKDLHKYLEDVAVVRRLRDLAAVLGRARRALVLNAVHLALPPEIASLAAPYKLELPGLPELNALVRRLAKDLDERRIRVDLSAEDLDRLAESLRGLTLFEAERAVMRAAIDHGVLAPSDLEVVTRFKQQSLQRSGLLDTWPTHEGFSDVGGLACLKGWLDKRRRAFTAEARDFGLDPPRGVVLLGVQGCGKSLCAKAVAKAWELPLLKLDPGRLYDKYIGETEKNLERALDLAARMAPAVLWIDELEKCFSTGGEAESDAGLSRRIFGRLLDWLQDRPAPIFVAATCNNILSLPPELVRKGRFDEIFFVDLPKDSELAEIWTIHLRKRKRDPTAFNISELVQNSRGFSGAEVEQALVSALYSAFSERRPLTTETIVAELRATHPLSVVRAEEIASLRQWAASRAVPAS
jgi:hypothetical protein